MGWDIEADDANTSSSYPRQTASAMPHSRAQTISPLGSSASSPITGPATSSMDVSCVTREMSQDDCSYARFVAWVAVKRNTHRYISSAEKLQCPLVRCRETFPDHERMLKHLTACEQLPTREYWCYEHMCIERFDDVKCRRCISHPSKRRRMLSMARTLFSTLGQRSRRDLELTTDLGNAADLLAPPSYVESQHESHKAPVIDTPEKPELPSSTEILEIDSHEVIAPVRVVNPQDLLLPELDCVPMQSSMQWQPTPFVSPAGYDYSTAAPAYESLSASQPTSLGLSSVTQLAQPTMRSVPNSTRSKNLSPSSSVRSTTSTMSNISSISTSSSMWSAPSTAWSGNETNFSTVSLDMISTADAASCGSFGTFVDKCLVDPLETISELPADAELHELSTGDLDSYDPFLALDLGAMSMDVSYPVHTVPSRSPVEDTLQQPLPDIAKRTRPDMRFLVATAWDALQEHILSSQAKIKHLDNPLVGQLETLSSRNIAQKGLTSLRGILEGRPLVSPLDTLSLIHVIYSFSLVVYKDDALRRSNELFAQSLLYSTWLAPGDQAHFREVATAIWRPSDMSDNDLDHFVGQQSSNVTAMSRDNHKGKAKVVDKGINADPLVAAAQNFLDELEAAAIFGPYEPSAVDIRARHLVDTNPWCVADGFGAVDTSSLVDVLDNIVKRFHDVEGLGSQLNGVNQSVKNGHLYSPRRFELEALQAGQTCFIPRKYFDSYVPFVRSLCDPIYELDGNLGHSTREVHFGLGISLSESLMIELETARQEFDAVSSDGSDSDVFLESFTTPLVDDLTHLDLDLQPLLDVDLASLDIQAPSTGNASPTQLQNVSPSEGGESLSRSLSSASSTSAMPLQTSPSSSSASPPQQQAQQPKIEADASCEICGYRPKGDPRWFHGSMAKHKRLQHSTAPPVIYKCPYPGCKSAYRNRPDNLRQHQIEKDHFLKVDGASSCRPSKRKKVSS